MREQNATIKNTPADARASVGPAEPHPLSNSSIDRPTAGPSTVEEAQRERADLLERAQELHRAMKGGLTGWGTDEDAVIRALSKLSPDQIRELRAIYRENYGTELDADISEELSGAELGQAEALLKGDAVAATADALAAAMAGAGTDEDALRSILKNYTGDRAALERTFQKRHGTSLYAALRGELSGDSFIEIDALRCGETATAAAARIHAAVDGLGTDEATLKQALTELSPADRREVGKIYRALYGESLESAIEGDVAGLDLDDARALKSGDLTTAAAARVKAALDAGSSRDLIAEFTGKSATERAALIAAYDRRYGSGAGDENHLLEHLKSELPTADFDRVESAIRTGEVSLAQRLHAAVDGLGTGAEIGDLLKELGDLPESAARVVATEYERRYNEPLAAALKGDLSGRLAFDAELYLNGLPADPVQRELVLAKRYIAQIEHDRSSGIANGIVDKFSDHGERADLSATRLQALVRRIERGDTPSEVELKALRELNSWAKSALQDVRDAKDSAANAAATAGATIAAGAAIVATAGAATPLVVAAATGAGAVGYTGAKALAQGADYETDGIAADLASGGIEGAANVVGAGIAAKAVAAIPKGALGRAVGFVADGAIDAGLGGAAGGAVQAGFTKETWENGISSGLAAVGQAALEQGAVGAATGIAMKGANAAIGVASGAAIGVARRVNTPDINPIPAKPSVRVNGRMVAPEHAVQVKPGDVVMIGETPFRIPNEYAEYVSGERLIPGQYQILMGKPVRLGTGPNGDIKLEHETIGAAAAYLVRGPDNKLYLRHGEPPTSIPGGPIDRANNDARTILSADKRTDRGYVRGEYGAPDYYLDRPVIARGTPIDGGVNVGAGFREAIVVDFAKDTRLNQAYNEFVSQLPKDPPLHNQSFEQRLLKKLDVFVDSKLGGSSPDLEHQLNELLSHQNIRAEQKVLAGFFLHHEIGVCRHRALIAGAFLERMVKEGRLDGAVEIRRNARDDGAHAWAVFTDHAGNRTVIDPMHRYIGPEDAPGMHWDYSQANPKPARTGAEPATQMVRQDRLDRSSPAVRAVVEHLEALNAPIRVHTFSNGHAFVDWGNIHGLEGQPRLLARAREQIEKALEVMGMRQDGLPISVRHNTESVDGIRFIRLNNGQGNTRVIMAVDPHGVPHIVGSYTHGDGLGNDYGVFLQICRDAANMPAFRGLFDPQVQENLGHRIAGLHAVSDPGTS